MRSPRTARSSSPRSPQLEKARTQQRRTKAAENQINKIIYFYLFIYFKKTVKVRRKQYELLLSHMITLLLMDTSLTSFPDLDSV